ncbi:MAG: hypothetical protein ACKVVP_04540, partial [Chloroflexota bacterium]
MFRVMLVLVSLMVGLVFSEVVLRVASPLRADDVLPFPYKDAELERIIEGDAYIRFDSHLGWAATESSIRQDGKITYQTNSAGMRSEREFQVAPPAEVIRLAAFGDSFTF